jgi:hypothetical protein
MFDLFAYLVSTYYTKSQVNLTFATITNLNIETTNRINGDNTNATNLSNF